jgi:cell division protein FtsB
MTALDQERDEQVTQPAPLRSRRRMLNILEVRARRRRIISYAALAISFGFLVNALVGEKGVLGRLKTRQDYETIEAQLARVRNDNAAMLDESRRLRSDPATIEAVARQKLHLIRPGETLVVLKETKPAGG